MSADRLADGEYRNGEKHGYWTTYYASGTKRSEGAYVDGKKEGEWIQYHKNGTRASVAHFRNGLYTGSTTGYYPNGNRKVEGQFNAFQGKWSDGKKTGVWTYYAEDGQTVWRRITYKNGSRACADEFPLGTCPDCDRPIESRAWKTCPQCDASLEGFIA